MKTIKLNLEGLDGNAFSLLSQFSKQARKEGWTTEEIRVVFDEATSGDRNHLLNTLMERCDMGDDDDKM